MRNVTPEWQLEKTGDSIILGREALDFVAALVREFRPRIESAMRRRRERQAEIDAGARYDFLPATRQVRESSWVVGDLPADLVDRRVEITGPVERRMIVNALNSGARVFMADFEDATAPTWDNIVGGQRHLFDAVRRQIDFEAPDSGKRYALCEAPATLMVRPRGLHLPERHFLVDGAPAPGALFDFGLYFFHNAEELLRRGSGPYFYLPKLEGHLEARIWNDVFIHAQERLGLARGTIKATVLIETLPAAFEMDEILHELREHSAGLNCGRWDYIFSFIKRLRSRDMVLPDRAQVTMDKGFLRACAQLLIRTCHRRGVHAMGGMAAQIPIKEDPRRNEAALDKVRADKVREVRDGHDGTWVAHPALVPIAREIFDAYMAGPNQIHVRRDDVRVTAEELLAAPEGSCTEAGLRHNVRVGVRYIEAWLGGQGCVPLYHLMEDAATAEISRAQVWQWLHRGARLEGGGALTREGLLGVIEEEMRVIRGEVGEERFSGGRFEAARDLFTNLVLSAELEEFLTLPAYQMLD